MSRINSYSLDDNVHGTDKLLGTDGGNGPYNGYTKNYTVDALSDYVKSNGDILVSAKMKVSVNSIAATAGTSTTILGSNHFNVISYTGANGVHTINLPSVEQGIILRFKTDGTIANTKSITLSPESGQLIDGSETYSMDRAYDGITILGYNDNWFIIQKKEK